MTDSTRDIWQLLEETAPDGCEAVQDLYSWSLNYDANKRPFALFMDLIGYSEDEYGSTLFSYPGANMTWNARLDYVTLAKLAAALTEYADNPNDVRGYVALLMDAEANS